MESYCFTDPATPSRFFWPRQICTFYNGWAVFLAGYLYLANGNMSVLHWFYKGLQLTIRFCSRRQGPNKLHSGLAEVSFKKTKEFQRFPMGRQGRLPWCTRGDQFPSRFQWWEPTDFHWFYKGLRLTIRFPGRRFLAKANVLVLQWFGAFLATPFFGRLL